MKKRSAIASSGVRRFRTMLFKWYVVIFVILFAALAILVKSFPYFSLDLTITRGLQQFHPIWFDGLMQFISFFGYNPQSSVLVIILATFLYLRRLQWEAAMSVFAGLGSTILGDIIKSSVNRPRPSTELIHVATYLNDPGFPSGHVLFYTSFFGFLFFLTFTIMKKSRTRTLLLIIFSLMILLIGPSRVYLGEHWASDTMGAYLLGGIFLWITIHIYLWGKDRFFVDQ